MDHAEERQQIEGAIGANQGFIGEFIQDFLADYAREFTALRHAVEEGDAARVERLAHGLKSVVGLFRATDAYRLCQQLESRGKEGRLDEAMSLVLELGQSLKRVEKVLRTAQKDAGSQVGS